MRWRAELVVRDGPRRDTGRRIPAIARTCDETGASVGVVTLLAVIAGGALGAVVRYEVTRRIGHWLGTLAVNVVGAFVLGVLVGAEVTELWLVAVGAGLCGSLTTWSSFVLDVFDHARRPAIDVVVATMVVGVLAARLGYVVGAG